MPRTCPTAPAKDNSCMNFILETVIVLTSLDAHCVYCVLIRLGLTQHAIVRCCLQALAGPGIPDHLHHRSTRHAEAEGGVMALAAQLPAGHGVLLGRPRPRPPAPENPFPQKPHQGGSDPKNKTTKIKLV